MYNNNTCEHVFINVKRNESVLLSPVFPQRHTDFCFLYLLVFVFCLYERWALYVSILNKSMGIFCVKRSRSLGRRGYMSKSLMSCTLRTARGCDFLSIRDCLKVIRSSCFQRMSRLSQSAKILLLELCYHNSCIFLTCTLVIAVCGKHIPKNLQQH